MDKILIHGTANLNHQQTHTKIFKLINNQENKNSTIGYQFIAIKLANILKTNKTHRNMSYS